MLNIPCTYNRCSPNEFSLYVLIFRKSLKRQYVRTGNLSNPSPSKWGQHIIRDAANCCLTVQLADVLADFAWLGALGECWCCLLALILECLKISWIAPLKEKDILYLRSVICLSKHAKYHAQRKSETYYIFENRFGLMLLRYQAFDLLK